MVKSESVSDAASAVRLRRRCLQTPSPPAKWHNISSPRPRPLAHSYKLERDTAPAKAFALFSQKSILLLSAAVCSRPLGLHSRFTLMNESPSAGALDAKFRAIIPVLNLYGCAPIFSTPHGNLQWPMLRFRMIWEASQEVASWEHFRRRLWLWVEWSWCCCQSVLSRELIDARGARS